MSSGQNKAVVRRYFDDVHNRRKVEAIEEIFLPEMTEPTRQAVSLVSSAFPDYQMTITAQVAERDLVATVWTLEGTHQGEWQSPIGLISATGARIQYTGTTTLRVENGKIAEVIGTNHDHLGLLQQMGALAAVAPRPGA